MYKKISGGFVRERPSFSDYSFEKVFGLAVSQIKPLGRLDEIKASPLASRPKYQGDIPSCVVCSLTWINEYYSWRYSGNDVSLSWPYVFTKAEPSEVGTKPRIVGQVLRKQGVCEDRFFSQLDFLNTKQIPSNTIEQDLNSGKYQIKNFSYIRNLDEYGLYQACKINPIAIGIFVNKENWLQDTTKILPNGNMNFLHMVVLIDFTYDGDYVILNWWKENELDIRVLDKSYPIETALSLEDLPDGFDKEKAQVDFFENLKLILNYYAKQFGLKK